MPTRRPLIALACALIALPAIGAEDWPEFRGPTGQGHASATGLPAEWSETKNVVWKQAIPGKGWSSPVIVKDRVYLTTAVADKGDELSLQVHCLEANSGKPVWDREVRRVRGPRIHIKNSHASPTPLIAGDRLYTHFGAQGTFCLNTKGEVIWSQTEVNYSPVHGSGGSPILVGDVLIYSCDGGDRAFVVGLEAKTGKVKWRTARTARPSKTFSFGTPLCIEIKGQKQVISPGSGMVAAYDPQTGKEIWKVRYPVDGYSVIPRPVHGHGLVYVCTGYDSPQLLAIRPDGRGDVTDSHVAWTETKAVPHTPSLLLVGSELYMVSDRGVASCLDAKTGKEHWQERIGGGFSASPVLADGKVFLQSEDGTTTLFKPGTKYEPVGSNSLEGRTLATLAPVGRAIYLRTDKHLYRIEQKDIGTKP